MALQEELKQQGDFLFRHRSHLPLLVLALGLWVKVYQEKFNWQASEGLLAEVMEGTALTVGLLGLLIRVLTVGFSPQNTSGRNTNQGQVADLLNTTGTYSLVRNPLYLGNFLMWLSMAMVTGSVWFVIAVTLAFWIYYERIMYAEESFLRTRFGDAYLDWASKTPAFVPTHLNYVAPETSFSWRKVARQEKNGLFALFLTFCVFGLVGDYAAGEVSIREECVSIFCAALSGTFYIFLKLLKKHSSFLYEGGR